MRSATTSSMLRLGTLAGSLLAVVVAAELALRAAGAGEQNADAWRVAGFHRPDPELIYSMRPNARSYWATDEFVEEVETNSLGLRGGEIPAKADGAKRILILGDSMTFGHGVSEDDSYPARLEAMLRERNLRVDVVNAGVKGYGNDQAVKLFADRLRGLDPDLVILAYYTNDLEDSVLRPLYRVENGTLVELDATRHPLYRYAQIKQALPPRLRRLRLAQVLTEALASITSDPPRIPTRPEEILREARRKLHHELDLLLELGRQDGFRVALVALPYTGDPPNRYAWLQQLRRSGLAIIDTSRDPAWRSPDERLFFEHDPHLTPKGHRRLATALVRAIEERRAQLLPDA